MSGNGKSSDGNGGAAASPPRAFRATSFDVAAAAGVSQSTVSRALKGDTVVSEATRARVAAAAAALNYHVDENAARLRTGKTGTLAVVVVCRADENLKDFNPFYYSLLGSVCAAAAARGHETLVSFQDAPETLQGRYHEQRKADGVILIGTSENRGAWDYFRALAREGAPLVCWGAPHDDIAWVRSDNREGAGLAVRHLIARGYRDIVCIASKTSPQRQFNERYEAYAEAIREAGYRPRLIAIEKGLPREEQGRRAAQSLLDSRQPFDGIFAVCDEIALGALRVLRESGVDVPGAVGLVGFDGVRAGAHATPTLTSVEPDFEAAGAMLVDRLLALLSGETEVRDRVPVRLLARGSTQR